MNKTFNKIIKKHAILAVLSVFAVVLVASTVSYALFQTEHENDENQTITIGTLDASISNKSGVNITDLYPVDESNLQSGQWTYTYTVSNSGDYDLSYDIYLTDNSTAVASSYPNNHVLTTSEYQYINFKPDGGDSKTLTSSYNSTSGHIYVMSGFISAGASEDHTIQFYQNQSSPNSLTGGMLAFVIHIDAVTKNQPVARMINGNSSTAGSKLAIGDQNFYILSNNSGTVRALAEYNLYVGSVYIGPNKTLDIDASEDTNKGKQLSTARGYVSAAVDRVGVTKFSSNTQKGTNFSSFVGSIVEQYTYEYVQLLKSEYNAPSSIIGDGVTSSELESLLINCSASETTCPTSHWITNTSFWTKQASGSGYIFIVDTTGRYNVEAYDDYNTYGVRPVIEIDAKDILPAQNS